MFVKFKDMTLTTCHMSFMLFRQFIKGVEGGGPKMKKVFCF